jgi:Rieske Fe-S protein
MPDDPLLGAQVVFGPAPRALPILPLKIEDNLLVVAGEFSAPKSFASLKLLIAFSLLA